MSVELGRLREHVAVLAAEQIGPLAEAVDRDARWPRHSFDALAAEGLLGLVVPRRVGGLEQGLAALVAVVEELAMHCSSSALCYGMHCVGSAVLAARATPDQEARFLVPIAEGRHITTLALSEPGTGVHFYLPNATFRREDDALVLNGTKSFVTNGGYADSYVLSLVAEDSGFDPGTFSCVMLERDTPQTEWVGEWRGMGMRGNASRAVEIREARVAAANLLGAEGDESYFLFEVVVPYFLAAMAATYAGIARRALDEVIVHLGRRTNAQTGETLGTAPVLSHRLGELYAEVEAARQFVHSAARRADAGAPDAARALMACKAHMADVAVRACNEALTLCGGQAYAADHLLARLLRDVRAAHVMAPTTDLLKGWIGRGLLGLPLL